jgi:Zn-dependent alcohol dehydrogenase
MSTSYGILTTVSVGQTGNVSFAASAWAGLNSRTHKCAQYGGADLMKDVPRYVKLMERGLYRSDKIATSVHNLKDTRQAMKESADRTTVSAHVVFDATKYTRLI